MTRRILTYRTEKQAAAAIKRLLKRYPVHADCTVAPVYSPNWMFPFRWLIGVYGRDGGTPAYWSAKR